MPAKYNPAVAPVHAGVDVSRDNLELCLLDASATALKRQVFANTTPGVRQVLAVLQAQHGPVRACLEPTSRWHEALALALAGAPWCHVALPNPRSVSAFASALSRRAKTDTCDAEILARMSLSLDLPAWVPPSPAVYGLNAVAVRLCQLTDMRTQENNRLKSLLACPGLAVLRSDLKQHIASLQRRGEALEREALALIKTDVLLWRRYALLLSIPGVGQKSAIQLLAFLSLLPPELDKRQWVASAGLDPAPRDSGQSHKPRHISRRGSSRLRRALYMPALVAMRYNPPLRDYYQRQTAKGKKPLVAMIALMVKLLHIIWAMWQSDQLFNPEKPMPH